LTEPSDVELVQRFRSGDPEAFDALVRRHQHRLYRLASVWLRDPRQAEDAVQEIFLRSWRGLGRFRFRAAPFTWLYRTARLVCGEYNRRRTAESLEAEPADPAEGPERRADDEEAARRVRELVAVLPTRQREVVMLRIFEELSVAETARAMGCRQGTVKALLHKAIARLRSEGAEGLE
jgi:RNA polymerase sigma-70 factor (ECF subfamily)